MKRTLAVRKETLAELAPHDLSGVAAGSESENTCVTWTRILSGCNCSGGYPTINMACPATELVDIKIARTTVG